MGSCRHESSDWWPAQRRASSARLISIRSASEGPVSGRRSLTRAVFDFAQVLGSVASSKFARTKSAGLGSSEWRNQVRPSREIGRYDQHFGD